MTKIILFFTSLLFVSCTYQNPFNFSKDYRNYPIAVDCEKPSDVSLIYSKIGLPTKIVNQNNVDFKIIKDDKGNDRNVCIFQDLTLLEFCEYKGPDEVAPYWVPDYQKINSVKCKEILK
jgi:hypothetical protein